MTIDLNVTYKKLGKLPLTHNGEAIPPGTKIHTTDGVWWELVSEDEWKRTEGPDVPFVPLRVLLN